MSTKGQRRNDLLSSIFGSEDVAVAPKAKKIKYEDPPIIKEMRAEIRDIRKELMASREIIQETQWAIREMIKVTNNPGSNLDPAVLIVMKKFGKFLSKEGVVIDSRNYRKVAE